MLSSADGSTEGRYPRFGIIWYDLPGDQPGDQPEVLIASPFFEFAPLHFYHFDMKQLCLCLLLLTAALPVLAKRGPQPALRDRTELAMNRLGFGARPAEVDRVVVGGEKSLRAWIDSQLNPTAENPKKLSLDQSLDADLTKHQVLTLSLEELQAKYSKESVEDDPTLKPDEIRKAWSSAKVMRAIGSQHQFQEKLVDLWFNHFNVDQRKGKLRWSFGAFERDAIRPNVFGKFQDLLRATARHPAMLFYLDNHLNRADTKKKAGINENYARELMELHTLGVDGGYTQGDVGEVARILTGWSLSKDTDQSSFEFHEKQHDTASKKVMGWDFPAGQGEAEGERLLYLLAHHPSTAKRIAKMLAENFVANPAPPALVSKLTQVYMKSGGDLKALYRTIVDSKEFWDPTWVGSRVKDHFTWTISAIRALDGEVLWQNELVKELNNFGEPLYQCAPPTGYTHRAEDLINSGVLLGRLNLALKLAANRIDGVYATIPKPKAYSLKTEAQVVRYLQTQVGLSHLSNSTTEALISELKQDSWQTSDGEVRPFVLARLTGLLLASPEFQRL